MHLPEKGTKTNKRQPVSAFPEVLGWITDSYSAAHAGWWELWAVPVPGRGGRSLAPCQLNVSGWFSATGLSTATFSNWLFSVISGNGIWYLSRDLPSSHTWSHAQLLDLRVKTPHAKARGFRANGVLKSPVCELGSLTLFFQRITLSRDLLKPPRGVLQGQTVKVSSSHP